MSFCHYWECCLRRLLDGKDYWEAVGEGPYPVGKDFADMISEILSAKTCRRRF
jgi:hypothetical protein